MTLYLYLSGIALWFILMADDLKSDPHAQWYHKAGFYLAALLWFLVPLVRGWPYVVVGVDWVRSLPWRGRAK